ncbi:MAG TPA: DUF72 domain-containing protein, partial [Gemmataceae bacterium]|nr:DUF72 domain-containing protein [Gemmataceae bacterium]
MNLYVGTSGYSYKEWRGSFYPKKFPQDQMLGYYAEQFHTVEINSTFKGTPTASVVNGWAGDVPASFRFGIKAPQLITHRKRLKDTADLVSELFEVVGALKSRLGPVLFQLPPNFKKDAPRLREFLTRLPARRRIAFEFRHPSWFDEEVFGLLRKRRTALCIADAGDDLEVPLVATTNWGYLRLRRPAYGEAALKTWIKRMRAQDWREAYV